MTEATISDVFRDIVIQRRSMRDFKPDPVPREIIEAILSSAQRALSNAILSPGLCT